MCMKYRRRKDRNKTFSNHIYLIAARLTFYYLGCYFRLTDVRSKKIFITLSICRLCRHRKLHCTGQFRQTSVNNLRHC